MKEKVSPCTVTTMIQLVSQIRDKMMMMVMRMMSVSVPGIPLSSVRTENLWHVSSREKAT